MHWTQLAILVLVIPFLQAHRDCTQKVKWDELLGDLNSLSNSMSSDCDKHVIGMSLCDPQKMLNMMEHNAKTVTKIMMEAESIYMKHKNSRKFVERLIHTRINLDCANQLLEGNLEPVKECFQKLDAFLENKKSHPQCAWEIVTAKTREILQRLQNRTVRRR